MDGRKITSPIRQETISIRGIVPGEYTVNVHYYPRHQGRPGAGRRSRSRRSIPTVEVVSYDTLTLDRMGQEKTAVRFRVADNGSVIDVNHRDKSLIQLTRSVRRDAAK